MCVCVCVCVFMCERHIPATVRVVCDCVDGTEVALDAAKLFFKSLKKKKKSMNEWMEHTEKQDIN